MECYYCFLDAKHNDQHWLRRTLLGNVESRSYHQHRCDAQDISVRCSTIKVFSFCSRWNRIAGGKVIIVWFFFLIWLSMREIEETFIRAHFRFCWIDSSGFTHHSTSNNTTKYTEIQLVGLYIVLLAIAINMHCTCATHKPICTHICATMKRMIKKKNLHNIVSNHTSFQIDDWWLTLSHHIWTYK